MLLRAIIGNVKNLNLKSILAKFSSDKMIFYAIKVIKHGFLIHLLTSARPLGGG